jgi:sugar/nucleoside kinase (ribokinase family)
MNVVCVGDCGVDHYLPSGKILCGGITANFALQARAVFPDDDTITIISAIGNDAGATVVRDRFKGSQVECRFTTREGPSSVQYIEVMPDGEKNFVRYDEGVLRYFQLDRGDGDVIAASDLRVIPVFQQICDFFASVMGIDNRGLTAVDFSDFAKHPHMSLLDKHIDAIDISFFGLSSDDEDLIDLLEQKAEEHKKLFVITLGADGSIAFHGEDTSSCAAIPVETVVDTTGAGDAFAAGFLSQYCYGASVSESLSRGASLSAGIIQQTGAN